MAVRANGSGDVLYSTSPPGGSAWTICGWAKRVANRASSYHYLAGIEDTTFPTDASNWALLGWNSYSTFEVNGQVGNAAMSPAPAVGDVFFWYLTGTTTGSTLAGGWRGLGSNTFNATASTGYASVTGGALHLLNDTYDEWVDSTIWNVKVWDRVLSSAELLVESFYERPMFPTSLRAWWTLRDTGDLNDKSGNGRNLTSGGTPASEASVWQPWKPGARIYALAAASGAPTLTAASVINLGSTVATPRVTFTR